MQEVNVFQPIVSFIKRISGADDVKRKASRTPSFYLEGELRSGKLTMFSVNGEDITTGGDTWVVGELKLGLAAKVKGAIQDDGKKYATSIVLSRE